MTTAGASKTGARKTRVKVCGLTSPEQALMAAELGADFLGLNFYPPSPRFVAPERAAEIASEVRGRVRLVGVFVNLPAAEVEAIDRRVGLDLLQFHGDEGPAELRPFAERAIKVVRVDGRADRRQLESWDEVWGLLLDTRHPALYGGSGESWTFASLATIERRKPTFIAGGLAPGNVRAAIAAARPWGVDVCSGVESAPGHKDAALLERFFKEIDDGESHDKT